MLRLRRETQQNFTVVGNKILLGDAIRNLKWSLDPASSGSIPGYYCSDVIATASLQLRGISSEIGLYLGMVEVSPVFKVVYLPYGC